MAMLTSIRNPAKKKKKGIFDIFFPVFPITKLSPNLFLFFRRHLEWTFLSRYLFYSLNPQSTTPFSLSSCSIISQFSHLVTQSDSLWPHGLQHTRLPCPSPTPGACSNSCPLNRLCHPTISSSVIPFFSCLWSFPASGSFPISQFFASGGRSIRVSASASVLPMTIQDWFPLGLTGWNSLTSRGLSRVFSRTTVQKRQWSIGLCIMDRMFGTP